MQTIHSYLFQTKTQRCWDGFTLHLNTENGEVHCAALLCFLKAVCLHVAKQQLAIANCLAKISQTTSLIAPPIKHTRKCYVKHNKFTFMLHIV